VLSVGALQLSCFFAFSNLGMQSLPAGRASMLAYTTTLRIVLLGETVTAPLAIGTALVVSGLAIVILDRSRD
jgi:drug/metabolite transporter (DMT)-like permease